MKKIYNAPNVVVVEIKTRHMFMNLSALDSLDGASWGGDTESGSIIEADTRLITGKSVWDEEW